MYRSDVDKMNCPKCHIDGDRWEGSNHIQEKDFDVEMEDKGTVGERMWGVEDGELKREVTKHLYQCPVCKECLIQ
jgi:hypothetical protein